MMKLTCLPNGLRVASRPMPGFETVAVGLYADTGSRHEPARVNGLAHLFEHMVFKGAGGRSAREISEAIEDVGGDLNACTERDGTSFSASLLAEHLPLGVELFVRHGAAAAFRRRRPRAREGGGAAGAGRGARHALRHHLRRISGRPPIRTSRSAARFSATRPASPRSRSTTSTAGGPASTAPAACRWSPPASSTTTRWSASPRRHLAGLPEGIIDPPEPARFAGGARAGRARADQAHLAVAYAGPAQTDADYYAARLFADLVGGGASSRLFQAVREDRGLAYSVWASLHPYRDSGIFHLYAATARREAAAAAALIGQVVADAAETASQRELDRVRTQAKAGLLMSLETAWGQAAYVARQLAIHGRLVEPAEVVRDLERVTLDAVRAAGARMLDGPRASATIGSCRPAADGRPSVTPARALDTALRAPRKPGHETRHDLLS